MKPPKLITMAHGNGGKLTHDLISELFVPAFSAGASNHALVELADSARVSVEDGNRLVFTTDSHVVTPLFFPGGDIGKLSVTGTANDIAVMGARPLYMSAGFIIEEGFEYNKLERVVRSMAEAARAAGLSVVTGDTKVVERGAADGLFINTSAIGGLRPNAPTGIQSIREGDIVIVSGSLGEHGIAIYSQREGVEFQSPLVSDCAAIYPLVEKVLAVSDRVRVMRDPTRGGLATTVNELVRGSQIGIELEERAILVRDEVQGACELLGFDPLYVANEGKLVLIVAPEDAGRVLAALRSHPLGTEAACIGHVTTRSPGRVFLRTVVGGERILDLLVGEMLPRIC